MKTPTIRSLSFPLLFSAVACLATVLVIGLVRVPSTDGLHAFGGSIDPLGGAGTPSAAPVDGAGPDAERSAPGDRSRARTMLATGSYIDPNGVIASLARGSVMDPNGLHPPATVLELAKGSYVDPNGVTSRLARGSLMDPDGRLAYGPAMEPNGTPGAKGTTWARGGLMDPDGRSAFGPLVDPNGSPLAFAPVLEPNGSRPA